MRHEPHHEPRPAAHLGLALALGVGGGLVYVVITYLFVTNQATALLTPALSPRQAAEAGLNKALYCLNAATGANCGGSFDGQFLGETNTVYGDASFTTTVSGTGHLRHLKSVGQVGADQSYVLTVDATDLPPMAAPSFAYALQAGADGLVIGARTTVTGNVISDGELTCSTTGATIMGQAAITKAGGRLTGCTVKGETLTAATLASVALPQVDFAPWEVAVAEDVKQGTFHPADGEHLGPLKVEGDLVIDENTSIRLDGPLWVTGLLTISRGSRLTLNSAFGPMGTAIIADRIVVEAGASLKGSGTTGSRLLLIATSPTGAVPAMTLAGAPGDALFLAPDGWIKIADRTKLMAAAAKRLTVGQRATIARLPSEAITSFAPSPGGTWRLKEETWKEAP